MKKIIKTALLSYQYIVDTDTMAGTHLEGTAIFNSTTVSFYIFYWCKEEKFWFYGNKSSTDKLEKILDAESIPYESKKDCSNVFITSFKSEEFTKAYQNL